MGIGSSEAETFWTEFLRKLARRGLRRVKLVVSDAHEGLKAAAAPSVPMCRPFRAAPWAWAQSSISGMPAAAQASNMGSRSAGWP